MNLRKTIVIVGTAAALAAALAAAGCGAATSTSATSATPTPATSSAAATAASPSSKATGQAAGALTGEAAAAATGDVPDNQVFLTVSDKAAGFSMKYPEGWAQKASGSTLTISDKNNIVRVAVTGGPTPTVASVTQDMQKLHCAVTWSQCEVMLRIPVQADHRFHAKPVTFCGEGESLRGGF